MAVPITSPVAGELYEIMSPLAYTDASLGYPLLTFCEALAGPLQEVWELIGKYPIASREIDNWFAIGSFEGDTADWTVYQNGVNGTVTLTDEIDAHSGEKVAKVVATTGTSGDLGVVTDLSAAMPVVAGEKWAITAYSKAGATPRQFWVIAAFFNVNNAHITSTGGAQIMNNTEDWTRAPILNLTVPATAVKMTLYGVFEDPIQGEANYVDSFRVRKGVGFPSEEYVDGDFPGYEWEGEPHLSRTIKHLPQDPPPEEYVPWSNLLNIDKTPYKALPWLGQLVGVSTPSPLTGESTIDHEVRIRSLVRDTPGFRRGSPTAMRGAIQPYLTGTKTVILRERSGGAAYQLQVLTRRSETPTQDWEATNLITHSSLEVGLGSHSAINGATLGHNGIPNIPVAHGVMGVVVSCPQGGTHSGLKFNGEPIVIDPGEFYTLQANVQMAPGREWYFYVDHLLGAGVVQTSTATFTADGTLQFKAFTFQVDPSADQVVAYILRTPADSASGGTQNIIWDAAQLEKNPAPTPYIYTEDNPVSRPAGFGSVGRAMISQKPGGIVITYAILDGNDYQLLFENHADYQDVFTDYTTYEGVFTDTPGT